MSYDDIIDSKKVHIMYDIMEREGFVFRAENMHSLFSGMLGDELLSDVARSWVQCSDDSREYYAYRVLYWGCNYDESDTPALFESKVYDYYQYIGDLAYYRGLINA